MAKITDLQLSLLQFAEAAAPGTPGSGLVRIYAKADGKLYAKDDAANEYDLTAGGGGSVATDAIWDADGDLAVGSGANTAARLAKGAAGGVLAMGNSTVIWNAGTSFPANKATGDRYWRTDLGMEFYWDGTRWLSTVLHSIELKQEDTVTWPLTANTTPVHRGIPPLGADYDYYLLDWYWQSDVLTTNDGTKYWTVTLTKFPAPTGSSSTLITANTSADTADSWYQKKSAINALLGSFNGFYTASSKTSTPGNHRFVGGHITCRVVGT